MRVGGPCSAARARGERASLRNLANAARVGDVIRSGLSPIQGISEIRGMGLMIGVDVGAACGEVVRQALELIHRRELQHADWVMPCGLPALAAKPALANEDPYGAGWLVVLKPADWASVKATLTPGAQVAPKYEAKMAADGFAGCAPACPT